MELAQTQKSLSTRVKNVFNKILEHNLFQLSSSVSYYSALAIAPFLMILLGVASFVGQDIQTSIIQQASNMSPQVGTMIKLIFINVNEGINLGSISGIIGVVILLWTSSLVFMQMRHSLDVIYGQWNPHISVSVTEFVIERLFAMAIVLVSGLLFIMAISLSAIVNYVFEGADVVLFRTIAFILSIIAYELIFIGIHYFAPTKKPPFIEAVKMAALTSAFFVVGNLFLSFYLKEVARDSIYGATGTLLVFLIWAYYSAFTIFLSVEVFLYLRKKDHHWL